MAETIIAVHGRKFLVAPGDDPEWYRGLMLEYYALAVQTLRRRLKGLRPPFSPLCQQWAVAVEEFGPWELPPDLYTIGQRKRESTSSTPAKPAPAKRVRIRYRYSRRNMQIVPKAWDTHAFTSGCLLPVGTD